MSRRFCGIQSLLGSVQLAYFGILTFTASKDLVVVKRFITNKIHNKIEEIQTTDSVAT